MRNRILTFSSSLLLVALAACGTARKNEGLASWYGQEFQGRRTAAGEKFNMHQYTAAHRTLPFGTRVEVTNRKTGKSVVVRINDRGPFAKDREIDLSYAAAKAIGIVAAGTARVEIRVLNTPGS